jgi:hypothetical protein
MSIYTRAFFLVAVLAGSLHPATHAAEYDGLGCITHGKNLNIAKKNYAAQCSQPRADCDPHSGRWFCASFVMDVNTPQYVFNLHAPVVSVAGPASDNNNNQSNNNNNQSNTSQQNASQTETQANDAEQNTTNNAAESVEYDASTADTARPAVADITDLILVTGQSNALGANTRFDASLDQPHDSVFAFTDQGWQRADLTQVWDRNWFPRTHPGSEPSNNFAFHFGKNLVRARPDRVVGFILATAPGQSINHWRYGHSFYREVENRVIDAINQLPHKSQLDGILWHQGETDANDTQAYTDALYTLIYYLRNESWARHDAAFICGETKQLAVNNRLNGLNRDSDPKTACVRATDLSTFADGHHFDTAALRTLGQRYADAYRDMLDK